MYGWNLSRFVTFFADNFEMPISCLRWLYDILGSCNYSMDLFASSGSRGRKFPMKFNLGIEIRSVQGFQLCGNSPSLLPNDENRSSFWNVSFGKLVAVFKIIITFVAFIFHYIWQKSTSDLQIFQGTPFLWNFRSLWCLCNTIRETYQ